MKAGINSVDKEFAMEILQMVDERHKEELRKVDHKYRSLKKRLEQWAKGEDGFSYVLDQMGTEGEENEENLERLMEKLRAD